jgi:ferritin
LAHELTVTASINNIYRIAEEVNDNAAKFMLHWFVTEQVEEEKNANSVLDKLALVDYNPAGILFLDKELSLRPAAVTVTVPWFTAA